MYIALKKIKFCFKLVVGFFNKVKLHFVSSVDQRTNLLISQWPLRYNLKKEMLKRLKKSLTKIVSVFFYRQIY